jgi:ketosteroid isomerase-like protein
VSKGTEFVRNWLDAYNRGDVEALVGMCHADVDLSNPDGTFQGPEGVRANFKPVIEATSERSSEVRTIVEQGDTVVAEFVIIGRHTGALTTPGGAVLPTGKIVSLPMIGIFELRDGKLAASRGQFDRMTLATQLGLLPDPAAVR